MYICIYGWMPLALVGPRGGGNISPIRGLASGPCQSDPGGPKQSQEVPSRARPGLAKPSHPWAATVQAKSGRAEKNQAEPSDAGPRGGHAPPTPNVSPHAETTRFGADGRGGDRKAWPPQADYKQTWCWKHWSGRKIYGSHPHAENTRRGKYFAHSGNGPQARPNRAKPG